jgi:NADH:ubiquinone oxidoreductase subunit
MRSVWDKLKWSLGGKQLVGRDSAGNTFFFRYIGQSDKGPVYRRAVEYSSDPADPHSIHLLWNQWLSGNREQPPTEKEIETFDLAKRAQRERIEEFEREDRKLRRQERAQRTLNEGAYGVNQPNVEKSFEGYIADMQSQIEKDSKK